MTKTAKNSNRYTKPQSQTVKLLKTNHIQISNRDKNRIFCISDFRLVFSKKRGVLSFKGSGYSAMPQPPGSGQPDAPPAPAPRQKCSSRPELLRLAMPPAFPCRRQSESADQSRFRRAAAR